MAPVIAVDTNILIYAHRDETPFHRAAVREMKALNESGAPWGVPVFCLAEFMRVVTDERRIHRPSTVAQALSFLDKLHASGTLKILTPGARYWILFSEQVRVGDVRGKLAFDAQIAAVCLEQGVDRLLTLDRDFLRFPSLKTLALSSDN